MCISSNTSIINHDERMVEKMSRMGAKYEAVKNRDQDDFCDENETEILETRRTKCSPLCVRNSIKTVCLILLYFTPSISLTFYQRWFLQDFHYPFFIVIFHLIVKFLLAKIIREVWGCITKKPRVVLNWRSFVKGVAPTGITSGIDVGFSNWGLELVTISLYTMTKSTTIIFILGCAIILKLEKKSWSLVTIVGMISGGLIMFTYKSTQFNLQGFILILIASFMSGLRWTCAQILLQKSKNGLRNPFDMIYHVQPWMILSLIPFAIIFEALPLISSCKLFRYTDTHLLFITGSKLLCGALIAFWMEFSEFLVVAHTSSLTLSIAGIFKEVFILILAVEWNGDQLSSINIVGLILCLCGISSHIYHKITTASSNVLTPSNSDDEYSYNMEMKEPLMDSQLDVISITSDEGSDTQILFNILNNRDR